MAWEHAATLPQALIDEFESGMVGTGEVISDTRFGVVNHTLVAATFSATDAPPTLPQMIPRSSTRIRPIPGY